MSKATYGKWIVVRSLSEGGQAHTFIVRAKTESHLGEAVLKRLKNVKRLERFHDEVRVLERLDHPNVVKLIDYDLDGARPFFVMEYCEGGNLDNFIPVLTKDRAAPLRFFSAIADGVAATHAKGVTHRDLKPTNILLRAPGPTPVVADFGICYVEDSERRTLVDEAVARGCTSLPNWRTDALTS